MADFTEDLVAAIRSDAAQSCLRDLVRSVLKEELAAVIPAHDQLVGAEEAAEILGLSKAAIYQAAARGRLPAQRIGRRLKFSRAALLAHGKRRPP